MQEDHKAELKKEKKIKRLLKKSAWSVGLGVGLLLLKLIVVPLIGIGKTEQGALLAFAWLFIFYGASIILSYVFLRKFLFKINILMSWIVLPLLATKVLMDVL